MHHSLMLEPVYGPAPRDNSVWQECVHWLGGKGRTASALSCIPAGTLERSYFEHARTGRAGFRPIRPLGPA
jgi:hypothetical protein